MSAFPAPAPRPKHNALLSHFTDTSYATNIKQQIENQGYVVVPSVLTPNECTIQLNLLWDFIEATAPGVQRNDSNTWYPPPNTSIENVEQLDPWPHSGWKFLPDMCQSFQAGWLFSSLRELLAERVFSQMYGTPELHSSKEGFTFHRPTASIASNGSTHPVLVSERPRVCGKIQTRGNGEHFDQCASDTGLHCIQSSTCFIDQEPGDGCFMCWPGSHREHTTMTKDIWRGRSDWVPLTDEELDTLRDKGMAPIRVPVKAGDVILWRSDLAHCGAGPSDLKHGFRAVSYTCMLPAAMTPPNVLDGKLEEYLTMQTGDHRPNVKSRHFAKPKTKKNKQKKNKGVAKTETKERAENVEDGKSGTFDKSEKDKGKSKPKKKKNCGRDVKIARGKYFVDGPPILTVRQAELYGLKEYGSDAVRDGVRIHTIQKR